MCVSGRAGWGGGRGVLEAWFPGPPLLDVASPVKCDI